MKVFRLISLGILAGVFMTMGFLWGLNAKNAQADLNMQSATLTAVPFSDEGNPGSQVGVQPGSDEIQPAGATGQAMSLNALPTQVPGETLVYFVPSDSDATATVIYLYNTDSVAHVVALRGYSYNGVSTYSQNINIGATSFLRLVSDPIAASPPPSWVTPAPIITNFTDSAYYASLSLPRGVKAEGYTLFNPGTSQVDPRADQGAVPLRFSTDPATVFLPMIH